MSKQSIIGDKQPITMKNTLLTSYNNILYDYALLFEARISKNDTSDNQPSYITITRNSGIVGPSSVALKPLQGLLLDIILGVKPLVDRARIPQIENSNTLALRGRGWVWPSTAPLLSRHRDRKSATPAIKGLLFRSYNRGSAYIKDNFKKSDCQKLICRDSQKKNALKERVSYKF